MDYTVFRTRLAALIESRGLSFAALADETGIARPTISRYVSGDRTPDLPYIVKLAEYFNVSIDWLIGMNGERYDVMPSDIQDLVHFYSLASESDRTVIQAVLAKYKGDD